MTSTVRNLEALASLTREHAERIRRVAVGLERLAVVDYASPSTPGILNEYAAVLRTLADIDDDTATPVTCTCRAPTARPDGFTCSACGHPLPPF